MDERELLLRAVGAVIGYAAALHRGYSPLVAILCGCALGPPLALVLFCVDGVFRQNERKRCQYCLEWIKPAAVVCRHCGWAAPLTPEGPPKSLRLVYSRPGSQEQP